MIHDHMIRNLTVTYTVALSHAFHDHLDLFDFLTSVSLAENTTFVVDPQLHPKVYCTKV